MTSRLATTMQQTQMALEWCRSTWDGFAFARVQHVAPITRSVAILTKNPTEDRAP